MEPVQAGKAPIKPHFFIKAFIAYLYFIQGFYLSLGGTIILLYPKYPNPSVLSHFSIAFLPFSFKYLTAPLVEKFTFVKYGRRKFAIVLSLFITTFLTFPLVNNLTNPKEHIEVVIVLFIILLFVSMGDISLDAASVKELDNPVSSSYIQMFYQSLGNIAGGLLLMKFVKPNSDWYFFETKKAVCSAQTFTLAVGAINLVVGILLHFFYKQRVLEEQAQEELPSFKKIFKYYLHFLNPRYKLCRFTIYLLTFNQGIKFFNVGFQSEAVYHGFNKEIIPEIQTICIFLALFANTLVSSYLTPDNMWSSVRKVNLIQLIFSTVIFLSGSFNKYVVIGTIIINSILHLTSFMLNSTKVNTFGQSMMAGICITTLASFTNFGNNQWLQLKIISILGFNTSVWLGLAYGVGMVIFGGRLTRWVEQGQPQRHQLWSSVSSSEKEA